MAKPSSNNSLYRNHHNNQLIQVFALIQLLTSGGPNYSTSTLMYYLYEKAFQLTEYGYANTIGVFLAVMIAIVSFVQFKALGNDVEY